MSRDRSALPPEFTSRGQRERLLNAALETVVAHGYPATSVAHIVSAAGVSRATFYECFSNKEECVLAAYDLVVGWLDARARDALVGVEDWAEGVEVAVRTILSSLDADPRLAPFCAMEIFRLGPDGLSRYEASIERLAAPLRAARADCPWGAQLPVALEQISVGGAVWLAGSHAHSGRSGPLIDLAPDIARLLLIPYLDPGSDRPPATASAEAPASTAALSVGP